MGKWTWKKYAYNIPVSSVKVASLEYGIQLVEGGYDLTEESTIHRSFFYTTLLAYKQLSCYLSLIDRVRYAEICGTKYSTGNIVACYIEDDMPVFGQIMDIIVLPTSVCLFVLKPFVSTTFNTHYHAFEVSAVDYVLFYQQHELLDFHPLYISKAYLSCSPLFVRCKYFLCEQWLFYRCIRLYRIPL